MRRSKVAAAGAIAALVVVFGAGSAFVGSSGANQLLPTEEAVPPVPVDVTNPVLPIEGTVSVDNFPAVQAIEGTVSVDFPAVQAIEGTMSVDNFPAVQAIEGTMSVDNFPAVQSVREVAHPAHQAVQQTVSIADWSVAFEKRVRSFSLPEVPEGKILVVQQVSVLARVPAGQHVKAEISTQGPTIPATHMIPLTLQGRFDGFDNWVGTENLTSYASGSFPGSITVERNSSSGDVGPFETVRVAVTGYLIDESP